MINDERKKAVTQQLAALVEEALLAEVTLSPKPGLVDALDAGAHSDMDYALFLKSAKTLTPFFEEMAQIAWQHAIDQELREKIAEIGRKAEKAMLIATDGINTHKRSDLGNGAIDQCDCTKNQYGTAFFFNGNTR